jgi:transcriptional regulator with XRE-family HTH domain
VRKGHPVTDEVPVWLQLVRQLYEDAGNPTLRTLSASSLLAHSSIDNILSGRNRPTRRNLVKLLGAFDVTDEIVEMILRAYDGVPPQVQLMPPHDPHTPTWLPLIRQLRQRAGNPSLRQITKVTGVPHATVAKLFKGEHRPSRANVSQVASGLTADKATVEEILAAYDEQFPAPLPTETRPVQRLPAADGFDYSAPTWLALLRVERYSRGNPTIRELAARSGIPKSTIGEIFRGTALEPFEETVRRLATATCENDPEAVDRIMAAFDRAEMPPFPFPELDFDARSESRVLADAMLSLAQSMIVLAASIDNYRADQQDRNQPPD